MTRSNFTVSLVLLLGSLLLASPILAADNELTAEEKAEGYQLLFNGRDFEGFKGTYGVGYSKWIIEDGAFRTCLFGGLARFVSPGHLFTDKEYQNYILKLDFRIPSVEEKKGTHSGVILRVGGKPADSEAGSLEFEIYGADSKSLNSSTGTFRHGLSPITKLLVKKDGGWNHLVLTVNKNLIKAELNGEVVNELNLDEFTTAGVRPDGKPITIKKFAVKDMPSSGAIGFRDDHGAPIWYKNLKLKPLP